MVQGMVAKRVEQEDAVILNELLPFIQHHDLISLRKRELLHKVCAMQRLFVLYYGFRIPGSFLTVVVRPLPNVRKGNVFD